MNDELVILHSDTVAELGWLAERCGIEGAREWTAVYERRTGLTWLATTRCLERPYSRKYGHVEDMIMMAEELLGFLRNLLDVTERAYDQPNDHPVTEQRA